MIDMHYDLLTVAYQCYLKNDYTFLKEWCTAYRKDNVVGVVANLYFMSFQEMKEQLGVNYYNFGDSVIEMFKIATNIVSNFLPDVNIIFSIEGCDYVDIDDLDELYRLGLRSIILVWNNKNKYGSGNRTNHGLTKLGKKFLIKAIDLGIVIDLSHANKETFDDMIEVIEQQKKLGKNVICYASHSNVRSLCNVERNLSDHELLKIKNVDGMVGVVSYIPFVYKGYGNIEIEKIKKKYFEHIRYLINILGIENVLVSTDDMNFNSSFINKNIYPYQDIYLLLKKDLLEEGFSLSEIYSILYKNAKKKIFEVI